MTVIWGLHERRIVLTCVATRLCYLQFSVEILAICTEKKGDFGCGRVEECWCCTFLHLRFISPVAPVPQCQMTGPWQTCWITARTAWKYDSDTRLSLIRIYIRVFVYVFVETVVLQRRLSVSCVFGVERGLIKKQRAGKSGFDNLIDRPPFRVSDVNAGLAVCPHAEWVRRKQSEEGLFWSSFHWYLVSLLEFCFPLFSPSICPPCFSFSRAPLSDVIVSSPVDADARLKTLLNRV